MSNKKSDGVATHTIKALLEISNAVNNTENPEDMYASIHVSLNNILNLENFAIAIYHEEKDSMTFPYFVDEMDEGLREVFEISKKQCLSAQVINAGKPLMFYGEDIMKMPDRKCTINLTPLLFSIAFFYQPDPIAPLLFSIAFDPIAFFQCAGLINISAVFSQSFVFIHDIEFHQSKIRG